VVIVLDLRETVREISDGVIEGINQSCNAIASLFGFFVRSLQGGAGKIAERFRAVLISALFDEMIDLPDQLIVYGYGQSLHGVALR
jgi:hypothetical protein